MARKAKTKPVTSFGGASDSSEEYSVLSDEEKSIPNSKIKDSVFTHLFADHEYLLQLYQALHPEDVSVSKEDLTIITIQNVLVRDLYNDYSDFLIIPIIT